MASEIKLIIAEMDSLKKEINFIKENMVEKEQILTISEFEAYKKSFNKDNLISSDNVTL
jgi:hypothetical protein